MPFPTLVAAPLLALAVCGWAVPSAASRAAGWPVPRPVVLAGYSAPADPFAAGHRGVDLAAYVDEAVSAPLAGTVVFSGSVAGTPVVTLDHGAGLRTTYLPVAGGPSLGARVRPGEVIGRVALGTGHCGQVPGCLHWGARRGASYFDPVTLLLGTHPVLLPLDPGTSPATSASGSGEGAPVPAPARRARGSSARGHGNGVAAGAAAGGTALLLGAAGAASGLGRRRLRGPPRGWP